MKLVNVREVGMNIGSDPDACDKFYSKMDEANSLLVKLTEHVAIHDNWKVDNRYNFEGKRLFGPASEWAKQHYAISTAYLDALQQAFQLASVVNEPPVMSN